MAGPTSSRATDRRARAAAMVALLLTLAPLGLTGCGFVPRSKLNECHRLSQTLRADNSRLKNVALELRTQNQDLTQRAVDDARRLAAQEEAVRRLEQSVLAYQSERDTLASAFEAMKRQVRLSAEPRPSASASTAPASSSSSSSSTGLEGRLEAFAANRPGWTFDRDARRLAAAADRLFEPGSPALRPEARDALAALSAALRDGLSEAEAEALEVAGQGTPAAAADDVQPARFNGDEALVPAPASRFLVVARAAKVRETLLGAAALDPGRVRLGPPGGARPDPADRPDGDGPRVVLRVVPRAGGLDAADATDK